MVPTTICPKLFKVKATETVLLWQIVKGEVTWHCITAK